MNSSALDLPQLEANLERLRLRMPDLPVHSVMLSRLLLHLGRSMSTILEHAIKPFGLSEAEFRVLTTLFSQSESGAHPTDLCAKTSQSPANMSRISDALVSRNLITRGPSAYDRRKMVLRITDQGGELVRRLLPHMYGPLNEMVHDFSDQEQLQLLAQLKRLGASLETALSRHPTERIE